MCRIGGGLITTGCSLLRPEASATKLPDRQWSQLPPTGQPPEQYAWLKHQPGECAQVQTFATVRWKEDGDLIWRYAYRVCQAGPADSPQAVFERHQLKGAKEQNFREVLSGLDLHVID